MDRGMSAIRLLNVYAANDDRRPIDLSRLSEDLKLARDLQDNPPKSTEPFLKDAIPAVAATALIAFVDGTFVASKEDLEWASAIILGSAMTAADSDSHDPSFFTVGADRSAALGLPCLLLPPFHEADPEWLDADHKRATFDGLLHLMQSGSDEVRRRAANGLERIWSAPCTPAGFQADCRHVLSLKAVEESVRSCIMGPRGDWSRARPYATISGTVADALDDAADEDILTSRLTASLDAACACVSANCCASESARPLRDAIIRASARGAKYWIHKHFTLDQNVEVQRTISNCMLRTAALGDFDAFLSYMKIIIEEPTAFSHFMRDVLTAATYDSTQRQNLLRLWPRIMTAALDLIEEGKAFTLQRDSHRDEEG
jgi:hypothetical protein